MNDIAHKIAERLYGDDKIKCELIFYMLNIAKRVFDTYGTEGYDEFIESLSEGDMDDYVMGTIEFCEEYSGLEKIVNPIREFGIGGIPSIDKIDKICEKENLIYLEDLNNKGSI